MTPVLAPIGPLPSILMFVALGWVISAATCLVVGTPRATPTIESVVAALVELGIAIDQLALADAQTLGETLFTGVAPDGSPASVVVIGRDASDARLLREVVTTLVYRDAGPVVSVSRSAQLEHRAYLLLMAARAGVPGLGLASLAPHARLRLAGPTHGPPGSATSVNKAPCAAPEPARPPPRPRSTKATATAAAAPAIGPATYTQ